MLRTVDLFSGIGGFSLGLEMAGGFETVAFCEQDKFCQQVLGKHWPDVPIHDDIRTFPTDGFGEIDLVCGGFPCQPWSVAGKREGHEDSLDRDLWPEMASIIENLRPEWVIGENVRGFVNEPMGLARTLADLDSLGYQSTYWILPAAGVGARHRRDRVWIIAHANRNSQPDGSLHAISRQGELVANADSAGLERRETPGDAGSKWPRRNEQPERCCNSTRHTWATEPDVGRVAHGGSRRVDRLRALGNAVVPQVVCEIGTAIQASYVPGVVNGPEPSLSRVMSYAHRVNGQ